MPIVVPPSVQVATAGSIINRALRLIGSLEAGESAESSEQNDALVTLNAMLDAWRTESLSVYALRTEVLTVTGAASYTIGSGGNLDTVRPVRIESAYQRIGGIDYPLRVAQKASFDRVADKSTTSDVSDWLHYEPSYPLGVLYLHPVPTAGAVHLTTWVPFVAYSVSDPVSLPPGYEEAITYQLAMRLAPEYGRTVPQEVAALGAAAKKDIKRANFRAPVMDTGLGAGRRYDIQAGY